MSWLRAAPWSNEVFDEDVDELSLHNKEWRCTMEKRAKEGFRDGIEAGKKASLQQGFNLGYREGAIQMKPLGEFKGILSTLRCWCQSQPSMNSESITQLLQKVDAHEEGIFEAMRRAQETPPPAVSELVEDMDELGIDQSNCGGSDCCSRDKDGECSRKGPSDLGESSAGVHTESLVMKRESLGQLFHRSMDLVSEMGLPEELRLHIQKLRDALI